MSHGHDTGSPRQVEHVQWVPGANLRDSKAMPFPLFPTLQDLKEALMNNEDLVLDGNLEPVDELLAVWIAADMVHQLVELSVGSSTQMGKEGYWQGLEGSELF
ncbi:hypothetical protein GGX14DRAFT_393622 [Mycena pura]|uniref:Uncharacterized protein n=1 Tax=Mycena pura TaxID=153505 RepID=A0AAD6YC26_9AGAR|nr:hypothetical protein GGX14DRAFT_393622 [Mycena pura]